MVGKSKVTEDSKRTALIEECQSYVRTVAGSFCRTMGLDANCFEDVLAAGYLGLVEAAERYDFKSGKKFRSFAFLRIRGAIIDNFRDSCDVSGRGYRYIRAFEALQNEREDEFMRAEVEKKEIGERPAKAGKKLARIFDHAARGVMAYRMSFGDLDDSSQPLDPEVSPEQHLESQQEWQRFLHLIDELPEKEQIIVKEYYLNGKSFVQIVDEYPMFSKSWVSRLHTRALQLLREAYENSVSTEVENGMLLGANDVGKRLQRTNHSQSVRTGSS